MYKKNSCQDYILHSHVRGCGWGLRGKREKSKKLRGKREKSKKLRGKREKAKQLRGKEDLRGKRELTQNLKGMLVKLRGKVK